MAAEDCRVALVGHCAGEVIEEPQIMAQVGGGEELLANLLTTIDTHLVRKLRIVHQLQCAISTLFDAVHQKARLAILDLKWDATDVAADDRLVLPQTLRHRQAEALTQRLL